MSNNNLNNDEVSDDELDYIDPKDLHYKEDQHYELTCASEKINKYGGGFQINNSFIIIFIIIFILIYILYKNYYENNYNNKKSYE